MNKRPAQVNRPRREDNAARAKRLENGLKVTLVLVLVLMGGYIIARELPKTAEEELTMSPAQAAVEQSDVDSEPSVTAEALTSSLQSALQTQDWDRVIALSDHAEATIEDDAAMAEIWNTRGVAEMQRGNTPDAVACFLKAIKFKADNSAYYFNWAEALRDEGQPEAALAPMRKAVELNPKNFTLKVKWSLLLVEAGQGAQVAKEIDAKSTVEEGLPVELGFAKVALLRASDRGPEAEKLIAKLKQKLSPEIFQTCLNDPVLAARR